jgi:hypothetical protein
MMRVKKAIELIQNGQPLYFEYGVKDARRWFIGGSEIEPRQAQKIITKLGMIPAGDCLFDGLEPQSWKLRPKP